MQTGKFACLALRDMNFVSMHQNCNHKLYKILCLNKAHSSFLYISIAMESHFPCSKKGNNFQCPTDN